MADDEAGTLPTGGIELRVAVRIFFNRAVAMEKLVRVPEAKLAEMMESTATTVAEMTMGRVLFMIEFEFLDIPDPRHRFARVGTDPRGMENPVEFDLGESMAQANAARRWCKWRRSTHVLKSAEN